MKNLEIQTKDLTAYRGKTMTGKYFSDYIIASFQVKNGSYVNILFDKDEELVHPDESNSITRNLSFFYHKNFKAGTINSQPCLIAKQ